MPTVAVQDILAELDRLLSPSRFEDYGPNGLQVPGAEQVETVATGVSAGLELFERAAAEQAQLLVVHHGLFWGAGPRAVDQALKRRLQALFDNDLGLAAYHLPLDAHPQLGNNALIAQALGAGTDAEATNLEPFALHHGQAIGFIANLPGPDGQGLLASDLFARIRTLTRNPDALVFDAGPERVHRLAIVSGAGSDYLADAVAAGADALLTGEPAERVMTAAQEAQIHFIAAGHYATETFGVKALGEHLAQRFGVRHVFLDIPNPI